MEFFLRGAARFVPLKIAVPTLIAVIGLVGFDDLPDAWAAGRPAVSTG